MKKFAKITGIVLACLLGVLIVVPIAFQGKIKEIVISEGNKLLNAEFGFDGPWLPTPVWPCAPRIMRNIPTSLSQC